ncbi:phage tail assembly chaperone [Komagataeibacter intermedius]|uniref:phage tail assembly chaperone n=1 Tax=Komagataeibacter intermedius TaxID=66229 RepID=UPI003B43487B
MNEIEVADRKYLVGKMPVMKQLHVARRMAPLMAAMANEGNVAAKIAEAVSGLNDADTDYIVDACLGVVRYVDPNSGGTSFPVMPRPGVLAYDFVDLPTVMSLVRAVIAENLGNFIPTAPSASSAPAAV